jgi:hypothetical protein
VQIQIFKGLLVVAALANLELRAATCESIFRLQLPNTTITKAGSVEAGEFTLPGAMSSSLEPVPFKKLPAFCRVEGTIHPTSDSNIEFEVWMPESGWNGRYLGVGNGGFSGAINYTGGAGNGPGMAEAVIGGYATSSTDTGHKGTAVDASWALRHPEKVTDYAYRAIHLTAVNAKTIIGAFYEGEVQKSYFSSCSNGGRQALIESQRYPADYAGIVAGDPSWFATHLSAAQVWNTQALMAKQNSYIRASKLPAIAAAVVERCDALDGITDGVLDDPRNCQFDPAVLRCKGVESDSCLTEPQIKALRKIYAGPTDSRGRRIFPGILPGGETGPNGWARWITGPERGRSLDYAFGVGGIATLVYGDPSWDFRTFNFDRDVNLMDEKLGPTRNATDATLKGFRTRSGTLILYHGWNDADIGPLSTANYYDNVVAEVGQQSGRELLRAYMVPGMQHCADGPGATVLGSVPGAGADPHRGIQTALERWVENGTAPEAIVATKYKTYGHPESGVARTRLICPYPQIALSSGNGSTDDAANFSCVDKR